MGIRLNQPHQNKSGDVNDPLKGVTRLVNPPRPKGDVASEHEDQGERHYVRRLLKVADQALHAGDAGKHRRRRGRPH